MPVLRSKVPECFGIMKWQDRCTTGLSRLERSVCKGLAMCADVMSMLVIFLLAEEARVMSQQLLGQIYIGQIPLTHHRTEFLPLKSDPKLQSTLLANSTQQLASADDPVA